MGFARFDASLGTQALFGGGYPVSASCQVFDNPPSCGKTETTLVPLAGSVERTPMNLPSTRWSAFVGPGTGVLSAEIARFALTGSQAGLVEGTLNNSAQLLWSTVLEVSCGYRTDAAPVPEPCGPSLARLALTAAAARRRARRRV